MGRRKEDKQLSPDQEADIIATVTDLPTWDRVLKKWDGMAWFSRNVDGMLDLYQNPDRIDGPHYRVPSGGDYAPKRGGYMNKGERQNAEIDRAFRMIEEAGIILP
jgi:hypothetical protein